MKKRALVAAMILAVGCDGKVTEPAGIDPHLSLDAPLEGHEREGAIEEDEVEMMWGYTEDELVGMYERGELDAALPTRIGTVTVTPVFSKDKLVATMQFEFAATVAAGTIEHLALRQGNTPTHEISTPRIVEKQFWLAYPVYGKFSLDLTLPLAEDPCGMNAVAWAFGEVWNEQWFGKLEGLTWAYKPKRGNSETVFAPSCPPEEDDVEEPLPCFYCELWVWQDADGGFYQEEVICYEIPVEICDALGIVE
jgi:hypothetical protein